MPILIETNTVSIRRAGQHDKIAHWHIHTSAVREILSKYYTPREIRQWLGSLRPEGYEYSIESKECVVAEYRGKVIGFGQMDCKNALIEAIYVLPDYVRRGIGTKILHTLEGKAMGSGVTVLQLCSSLYAVPFYENAGFKAQLNIHHQLPDGTMLPCIYMIKKLLSSP